MARGVPLTDAQLELAAAVYAKSHSYAEAGRAIGVDESVARRALLRRGESERVVLHARAVRRGMREGRKLLRLALERAPEFLADAEDTKSYKELVDAVARATETLAKLDAREDQRRQARLTRKRTKAEITALSRENAPPGARLILPAVLVERDESDGSTRVHPVSTEPQAG